MGGGSCANAARFNPRACVRRDKRRCVKKSLSSSFNPRACVRRDYEHSDDPVERASFNPRACVRRDLRRFLSLVRFSMFQSTRLREARPQEANCNELAGAVSIHAPA